MTIDWDTFDHQEVDYDGTGNYTTLLAADATHLYFLTKVTGVDISALSAQLFFIGVAPNRMLQIKPFDPGDGPMEDDNDFDAGDFTNNTFGGMWDTSWTLPTVPTTDFHRILDTTSPEWRLEGRIALTDLNISHTDSFDIFLHIRSGSSGSDATYWPPGPPSDLGNPTTVSFGDNRCPDISFEVPYLNFGKVALSTSQTEPVTISNDGVAGSELTITSASLDALGDLSITLIETGPGVTVTRDSDGAGPPFTLAKDATATVQVQYNPTTASSLLAPHVSELQVVNSDPDEGDDPATLPIQGNGRNFIDTIFILDQSGSMTHQDKWVTTEWASDLAYEAMRLFAMSQDRVGAVWFGGTSSSPDAGVLTPSALDFFAGSPGSFAGTFSQDAQSNYYTPIGLGLEEAHDNFGSEVDRLRIGLLMSDGIHNRPTSTSGATTVAGLSLPANVENNTKSMHVHTVALGTDSGVSTDLLEAIRNAYQVAPVATAPPTTYNISEDPADLATLFVEPLMEPFVVNRVDFDAGLGGYPIEQNADRVLAMVAWNRGTTPIDIRVRVFDETGTTFQETYDSSTPGITYVLGTGADEPYTYILVDNPEELDENRVWIIEDTGGAPITSTTGVPFVLVDLNIIGSFDAQQLVEGTGNDYLLSATLHEVGRPITNTADHPVEVRAELARPGEGFGHLVSTVSLDNCEAGDPILPDPIRVARTAAARLDVSVVAPRPMIPPGIDTTQVDITDYRFLWAQAYFERCGRDDLLRLQESGLRLYDDGTNGDQVPNDGVYTLRFTDTEYEGSYNVRFSVTGTSPTGARFSRTRTLSTYIPVAVDPSETVFDSRVYANLDDGRIWEFYVIPQDRFNRYVGPGKRDQVDFEVADGSGTIVGDVRDYNNGIYSILVRQESGRPKPEVTATVGGTVIFPPVFPGRFEIGVFAGLTVFDDALEMKDGPVVGGRLGYRLRPPFVLEAEGAVTFADNANDVSGMVIQLFGGGRYEFNRSGRVVPFVTGGAGYVLFRDFGVDDEAFAAHGGAGVIFKLSNNISLRGDVRTIRIEDVLGAGATTNYQTTGGILIRF